MRKLRVQGGIAQIKRPDFQFYFDGIYSTHYSIMNVKQMTV